jgi:hypothetical protein
VSYVPAENYHGTDGFSYRVDDGVLQSEVANVTIQIAPVNDAPTAANQTYTLPEDSTLSLTLSATDVDGDSLSFTVNAAPSHGTLSGMAPNLTYTPSADYFGADSLTYTINDGQSSSGEVTVNLVVTPVNDAPVAIDQSLSTTEDTPLSLTLGATDLEGDALTFVVVTSPVHGSLSGTAPNLVFTPSPDYSGSDTFTFKVNDGSLDSAIATVGITISGANDEPTASALAITTPEDTAVAVSLVGSDPDGDSLTFTVVDQPSHGVLSGAAPNLSYTPSADFHGVDTFTFKTSDAVSDSLAASVAITVTPVNDAPVAVSQQLEAVAGIPLPITLSATDVDGDAISLSVLTPPTRGVLSGQPPSLTYTANAGFSGTDSFTFAASDGVVNSSQVEVSIEVALPQNHAPSVNAGADVSATVGPIAGKRHSNIIINHDEWTLTEQGFGFSPYAGQFARNVASWFTGGSQGKFLAYTKTELGSVDTAFKGASFRNALEADGHTLVTSSIIPFTLETLRQYDAVFLAANNVDNQVLIDYVNAGGNVYISAGSKYDGSGSETEANWYNVFLNTFGLAYGFPYNGISGTPIIESSHPIFDGIYNLYYAFGNPVIVLNPSDPRTKIINRYQGSNLIALYSRSSVSGSIQLTGSAVDSDSGPSAMTYAWTLVSGPEKVIFENAGALSTRVTFDAAGTYILRLTASDGETTGSDEVVVQVEFNEPPQVYSGGTAKVLSPSDSFVPLAVAADDGLPGGSNLTLQWRLVDGPGIPSLAARRS